MSIQVNSDLPILDKTFSPKFGNFQIPGPLKDNIVVNHHFTRTIKADVGQAEKVYFRPPWAVYQKKDQWIYHWIRSVPPHENYYQTVITNKEHTRLDIYNDQQMKNKFLNGNLESLTMFPTDQILTARFLAYRNACIIHSVGVVLNGEGYLFVGHSDAGKSTMALMMKEKGGTILCDDRNVIRKHDGFYYLSGTWSHGDVADVSSKTVPLKGIYFLHQAPENEIAPITDDTESFEALLACLIKPFETRDWWEKSLDFLTQVSSEVDCFNLWFNKDGNIVELLNEKTHA